VDPSTGAVLRQRDIPGPTFSEGLALVDGTLVQLSWKAGTAFRWARTTFNPEGTFAYDGEGWGLCFDGTELIMSDGSATLTRRDPSTFAVLGRVEVRDQGAPVPRLNELECVGDEVYANVWLTDEIVRIDARSGRVTATIDASPLRRAMPTLTDQNAVLNGIAYDAATGHLLLTGKLWPALFEVDLKPAGD
jgi:glutamine cyclotransferase